MEQDANAATGPLVRRSGRVIKASEKARVYQQQKINAIWERIKKNSNTKKRSEMRAQVKAMKSAQKKATEEVARYSKLYKGVASKRIKTMKKLSGLRKDYSKGQTAFERMMTHRKKVRNNQTRRHRMGFPPATVLPLPPPPPPARLSVVPEAKPQNKNMNEIANMMSKISMKSK